MDEPAGDLIFAGVPPVVRQRQLRRVGQLGGPPRKDRAAGTTAEHQHVRGAWLSHECMAFRTRNSLIGGDLLGGGVGGPLWWCGPRGRPTNRSHRYVSGRSWPPAVPRAKSNTRPHRHLPLTSSILRPAG